MVQRRTVIIGLSALPVLSMAGIATGLLSAQEAAMNDIISTDLGEVTVHPVQHASLVLVIGNEVIYVDPVGPAGLYEGLPAPTAVLITHQHGDHFDAEFLAAIAEGLPLVCNPAVYEQLPEALRSNATALANGDSGDIAGVQLEAIPAYNITPERLQFHPEGRDNGYILTFGTTRVLIAGDTEDTPELRALRNIDVAFLPMNLPFTMTVAQAADAVNAFRPRIVYPYHYADSDLAAFEAAVDTGIEVRRRDWYPTEAG